MDQVICWLEVNTTDADAAKTFYTKLFGWKGGEGDVGFPYHFLKLPDGKSNFGGIMPQAPDAGVPPHWMVYFPVGDLSASLTQLKKLGGQVRVPLVKLPQGQFAIVADPQGAAFALFQPAA